MSRPREPHWRETYMEAWPDEVLDLSIPSLEIELDDGDRRAIGSATPSFRHVFDLDGIAPVSPDLRRRVAAGLGDFPGGAFARLGPCSFKRALASPRPLRTADEVLREALAPNERVAGELAAALEDGYPVSLFLREWRDIPAWAEFRVFIEACRIRGVSQYHIDQAFPEIERNLAPICLALAELLRELLAVSPLDAVVADVFVAPRDGRLAATLIELNPFADVTGAGLYTWSGGGDFDGALRYRGPSGAVATVHPRAVLQAA